MRIYLIGFVFVGLFAKSQSLVVNYEKSINIDNYVKNRMLLESGNEDETTKLISTTLGKSEYYTLVYDNGESLYTMDKVSENDETLEATRGRVVRIKLGSFTEGIYKNHKTNVYLRDSDILGRKFLVSDNLEKINWKLSDEEKNIGDYKAKKAIAVIDDEDVIAWYADDIPIADGPYDYHGLPGLILELTTNNMNYHAVKITNSNTKLNIVQPSSKGKKKLNKSQHKKILFDKIAELKEDKGMVVKDATEEND